MDTYIRWLQCVHRISYVITMQLTTRIRWFIDKLICSEVIEKKIIYRRYKYFCFSLKCTNSSEIIDDHVVGLWSLLLKSQYFSLYLTYAHVNAKGVELIMPFVFVIIVIMVSATYLDFLIVVIHITIFGEIIGIRTSLTLETHSNYIDRIKFPCQIYINIMLSNLLLIFQLILKYLCSEHL